MTEVGELGSERGQVPSPNPSALSQSSLLTANPLPFKQITAQAGTSVPTLLQHLQPRHYGWLRTYGYHYDFVGISPFSKADSNYATMFIAPLQHNVLGSSTRLLPGSAASGISTEPARPYAKHEYQCRGQR